LEGLPEGSRASKSYGALRPEGITEAKVAKVRQLNQIAQARGQTMAQLAITWVLRHPGVTSALIGASRVSQIEDVVAIQDKLTLTEEEQQAIEQILTA
jgi:L-glyceraldehyde 3-phosphate reductase